MQSKPITFIDVMLPNTPYTVMEFKEIFPTWSLSFIEDSLKNELFIGRVVRNKDGSFIRILGNNEISSP